MEIWYWLVLGLAIVVIGILIGTVCSLRHAMREIERELREKLDTDTNTTISVSSGDRSVRALAVSINRELRGLRAERRLLQNGDIALKEAVTNVSHDLRTPLTAICGYLDLLEAEGMGADGRRYLAVIRERTDTMRRMTEELFRYSVVRSGTDALHLSPVRINDVLAESLAGFYAALTAKGITPEIALPEEAVVRLLHAESLRRVFDNILQNAVKYADGALRVTLTEDGTVTFTNPAAEMSPVQVARLFDRFYTVETARTATGLGLSIARNLTEKMHGAIDAGYVSGVLSIQVYFPDTLTTAQEETRARGEK